MFGLYFNYELSWILVPIAIFLYMKYSILRPVIFNTMIYISIIGMIYTWKIYNLMPVYQFWGSMIFHAILLVILKDFSQYGYFNLYSVLLMILSILVIKYLPWWPYTDMERKSFIKGIFIINFILYFLWLLIPTKHNINNKLF